MFWLAENKIERDDLINELKADASGACVIFEGWVRDHNEGKSVSSLEYQVYPELAQKEGQKILDEAREKFNLQKAICSHRFGHLHLGDTAVFIGTTASHRDDAYKASRYIIDEIKLRLPIWKKEHYTDLPARWVFCKDHHTHVHFEKEDYFKRQENIINQANLNKARVLVVGAGGLGCPVLTNLTMAGVGHIDIVDFDTISISNIHRQPLYTPEVVGEKKVIIAKNKLRTLNPFVHIHAIDKRVDAKNIEALTKKATLIVDCTDNLETKYLLNDASLKFNIPLISASIYKFEGQVRSILPKVSACLRCHNPVTPADSLLGNCNDYGVLGASVSLIGNIQAHEALMYLNEGVNNTMTHSIFFDTQKLTQLKIKNSINPSCRYCSGDFEFESCDIEVSMNEIENAQYVDVRDKSEQDLEVYFKESTPIVLYCHKGIRSKEIVSKLREMGHQHFYSLIGGACSF